MLKFPCTILLNVWLFVYVFRTTGFFLFVLLYSKLVVEHSISFWDSSYDITSAFIMISAFCRLRRKWSRPRKRWLSSVNEEMKKKTFGMIKRWRLCIGRRQKFLMPVEESALLLKHTFKWVHFAILVLLRSIILTLRFLPQQRYNKSPPRFLHWYVFVNIRIVLTEIIALATATIEILFNTF